MTHQERINLELEKASYEEAIKQFTSTPDARMEISLDKFLCDIEDKIKEINKKLNG